MSDMFDLDCWILGDKPEYFLSVEVAKTKTIGGLKKAIKDERDHTLDGVDAALLKLWKVDIVDLDSLNRIKKEDDIPGERLRSLSQLSYIFTDRPEQGHLHIVVQCPDMSDHHRDKRARIHEIPEPDADLLTLRKHFWRGGKDLFVKHSVQIPDPLSLKVKDDSEPLNLTVIEHPGGRFRFRESKLLVPEIFETFWNLLESEDEEWQELLRSSDTENPHHATIITGQPGIGKTAFLTYVLLFRMTLGKTTIYCDRESYAYIFDDKGVRKMSLLDEYRFPELEIDPGCCALVNISDQLKFVPGTFYPLFRRGRVVVAASPDSNHWRSFSHECPARICYMPTWSWETLYFGSLLATKKAFSGPLDMIHCKRLQHAYSIFRGVPRLCYRALKGGLERELGFIKAALDKIQSMEDFSHATKGMVPFDPSTSHRLIRVEPIDDKWEEIHTELLSDYVAERVFNLHQKVLLSETLVQYLADPDARSKGGTLFEHAAHSAIRRGCNLTMIPLPPQSNKEVVGVVVPPVQDDNRSRYFSLAIWDGPGSQNVYPDFLNLYMTPISKTEPSIDALFISKQYITFLFQMTVSNHHPVGFQGLDRVVSQLPAKAQKDIRIVFITPPQSRDALGREFRGIQSTQTIINPQGADLDKVKKFKLFPQYVCQLDIDAT